MGRKPSSSGLPSAPLGGDSLRDCLSQGRGVMGAVGISSDIAPADAEPWR